MINEEGVKNSCTRTMSQGRQSLAREEWMGCYTRGCEIVAGGQTTLTPQV
jgi:hypothetical protein